MNFQAWYSKLKINLSLTVVENVFGVDVIIKVCGRKQDLQILVATYHSFQGKKSRKKLDEPFWRKLDLKSKS